MVSAIGLFGSTGLARSAVCRWRTMQLCAFFSGERVVAAPIIHKLLV